MSETPPNGQARPSLRELRERRRLAEVELEVARLRRVQSLTEDLGWSGWPEYSYGDFGGTDTFIRARTDGSWVPVPPSVPSDRRHGQQWPLWRTEPELDRIRQQGRLLLGVNSFARGLLTNRLNYTVGKGFSYKAIARHLKKGQAADDSLQELLDRVQDVLDEFLQLNRWNAVLDPRSALVAAMTREQECYCRCAGDGEAFVRFYFVENGVTHVRFAEPEQVRNPPNAVVSDGWSFGIRHQMRPFEDVEAPEEYWFTWQDPATAVLNQDARAVGEAVDAKEVLHLKGLRTPSNVKRGITDFAYDVARSLERAARLQRNISAGAADRAATSEIIQFRGFTRDQVSAFVGGESDRQWTDPYTGQTVNQQTERPAQRRRIPAGMEFVQPPQDNSTPAFMQALAGDLRQAAAFSASPEYWLGDASNGNYSSLETASAPPVKNGETEQEYYRVAFAAVAWKALRWAAASGRLPPGFEKVVDLQVEAPAVLHRNELEKAQADQIKVMGGWKSPQTCAMEDGLDPETELRNAEEFRDRTQQGQLLGLPGEPGAEDDGGGEGAAPPPGPKPPRPPAPRKAQPHVNESLSESLYPDGTTVVHYPAAGPSPGVELAEAKDAQGHEHKGKGPGGGQFTGSGGGGEGSSGEKEKGSGGEEKKADFAANRPSKPEERHAGKTPPVQEWKAPPPPQGKNRGTGRAVPRGTGAASQTALGDAVEDITSQLELRSILPAGRRAHAPGEVAEKGSTIDREFDHSGIAFEIKACRTSATEYKAKPKKSEIEGKRKFAEIHKLQPGIMIPVVDEEKREIHVYWRLGLGAFALNPNDGGKNWNYAGTIKY